MSTRVRLRSSIEKTPSAYSTAITMTSVAETVMASPLPSHVRR